MTTNSHNDLSTTTLAWLLKPDSDNPGVRYFALTDLLEQPTTGPDVVAAQQAVMTSGPVPIILANQQPDGRWTDEIGPGYYPKYTGTIWSVIFLGQLGANGSDPRVKKGCEYLLMHACSRYGGLSADGKPSGMIHCLQGNLAGALIDLGWLDDPQFDQTLDWLARSITGEGISPAEERDAPVRYYRSGNSGPGFCCSANNHLPCAWGAVKALWALSKVPIARRTPAMQAAITQGTDFLLSHDPAVADYPMGYATKPNRSWFKFGYPIGYVTDVLQILEVLTALGHGTDPRLQAALNLVLHKQDSKGRWKLDYTYNGKTWVDVEEKGKPSKWVTLRALRVLKQVGLLYGNG
jgi:hypothetical protein